MDTKALLKLIDNHPRLERRSTGSGHHGIYRDNRLIAVLAKSPRGGRRSTKNAAAQLRRIGVEVPR